MTNKDDDFGVEFWLHVIGDSTTKYIADGGHVDIRQTADGITITLLGISMDNEALPQKFTDATKEMVHQ